MQNSGRKVLHSAGAEVQVAHLVETAADGTRSMKITATCGKSRHITRSTFGAVDGPHPVAPTAAQMQQLIDADRQQAADRAAFKEKVRLALEQVE